MPILLVLQEPKEFDLCGTAKGIYLIEEKGSPLCFRYESFFSSRGIGKGPLCMPEKLIFNEVVRQGSTINRNKRLPMPVAIIVDCPGNKFFPGSRLPVNHDCRI
ncbi:hypothetical protein BROSI_A0095 [Candidatus Brocadia sinica JPN1]|uniref:Uncharacterized protein n=1 Tax=Candidatus Brocadia sinica JPN1 TaxID=1197129 RepID=A0ABQ0JS88_9BACT|nr:hypothetical protein BROSI_A0095 [Candidatus Brocadia sinica JPN1]GIK12427.1 MAG: hypothetical protein BroJett002_11340 [Candidatus Brocadia sinica]GJQ17872.1 MAG: hypothetical protein HBSIN01_18310 [Candidatus Brocadia sinica]